MIARLAFRYLTHRPWRSLLLLGGYGLGVGVMIVLLAIGQALLTQAREERLVGGGEITVLPEGLDLEVMKTGGVGGLFFSIDRARFVYRQLLASPRLAPSVAAAAPQMEGKLLYLRTSSGEYAVRAWGGIPSRDSAVGAAPELAAGAWRDDEGDRAWIAPTPRQLYSEMDRFHLPPAGLESPESWAEWHYFNVLSADRRRWAFISFIVGGMVPDGAWGGQVAITLREQGARTRRFTASVPGLTVPCSRARPRARARARPTVAPCTAPRAGAVRFSTTTPDVAIGSSSVTLLDDGTYRVRAVAREANGRDSVRVALDIAPAPRAYFPGAELASGPFVSGYTVPGLRASATGRICVARACERYSGAQAYHDHNWGTWRGVTWEWGAARAGRFTLLYGRVNAPDTSASRPPLFVYLVDSLGFRAIFRPRGISYTDARTIRVDGRAVRVPARAVLADVRGSDTLRVEITIEDAVGTDTRRQFVERGDVAGASRVERPYFIQMKGRARLSGRAGGGVLAGEGTGFFETYR